eukprot:scaffold11699_cov138-Skeletonema_dohrnii-CCMP3373.AAC.4
MKTCELLLKIQHHDDVVRACSEFRRMSFILKSIASCFIEEHNSYILATNASPGWMNGASGAFAMPATKGPLLDKSHRHNVINRPVQLSMSASFSADNSNIMLSGDDAVKKRVVFATTLAGTTAVIGLFLNYQIISQAVLSALRSYEGSLVKNPLRTKVMTGAFLAAFGDYLAQLKDMRETNKEYNVPRALSFAAFDSCYRMFQHAAIPFIVMMGQGHVIRKLLSSVPLVTMKESSLAFTAALERTLMYQFVLIPFFYYPIFFTFTGLMVSNI